MNYKKIKEFASRCDNLFDKNYSVRKVLKNISNVDLFLKEKIINETNIEKAEALLKEIEKFDLEYKKEFEKQKTKEKIKNLKNIRNDYLIKTDWTQIADAEIDQQLRLEYREYRRYLRRIFKLYKNKQILKLEVMDFKEWKENPPKYGPELKPDYME